MAKSKKKRNLAKKRKRKTEKREKKATSYEDIKKQIR